MIRIRSHHVTLMRTRNTILIRTNIEVERDIGVAHRKQFLQIFLWSSSEISPISLVRLTVDEKLTTLTSILNAWTLKFIRLAVTIIKLFSNQAIFSDGRLGSSANWHHRWVEAEKYQPWSLNWHCFIHFISCIINKLYWSESIDFQIRLFTDKWRVSLILNVDFIFKGGAYTMVWFDEYAAGLSLLCSALFETVAIVYCYGNH